MILLVLRKRKGTRGCCCELYGRYAGDEKRDGARVFLEGRPVTGVEFLLLTAHDDGIHDCKINAEN
jgi:hypothetical protein